MILGYYRYISVSSKAEGITKFDLSTKIPLLAKKILPFARRVFESFSELSGILVARRQSSERRLTIFDTCTEPQRGLRSIINGCNGG